MFGSKESPDSPLKGKLSDLEMRDVKLGAEVAKGAFGTIVEVTVGKEKFCGQKLCKSLLSDDSKKSVFSNFPTECSRLCHLDPHPNVVKLRGIFLEDKDLLPILLLERTDGDMRTLATHLQQQSEHALT